MEDATKGVHNADTLVPYTRAATLIVLEVGHMLVPHRLTYWCTWDKDGRS